MNIVRVFQNFNIRFVEHPDNLFDFGIIAEDLSNVLEASSGKDIARSVDDEWVGAHSMHTNAGNRNMTVIWEPGVYQLLSKSRKPKAKPFQKWLFEEVLPSIRKTGKYEDRGHPTATIDPLLASIEALVAIRKDQLAFEARLSALEQQQKEAEEELSALPLSQETPPEIPTRGKVNLIIRNKAQRDQLAFKAIWTRLYTELYYRYSYDVKARCRNSKLIPLDQIEKDGMMDKLHAIASETLV